MDSSKRERYIHRNCKVPLLLLALMGMYFVGQYSIMTIQPQEAVVVPKRQETTETLLRTSERLWQKSVEKRHQEVGNRNLTEVIPWDMTKFIIFWNYFYPSFPCPHQLERIGGIGDGGKWVCGLNLFESNTMDEALAPKSNCVVYSFGVGKDSSFEAEIYHRTNCQIYAYDFSVTELGPELKSFATQSRVHFKKTGLGKANENVYRTLGSLMRENGHTWIDILKMDIEGSEFEVMKQVAEEFDVLPFGQLEIEVHISGEDSAFPGFYEWWEMLESKGLRPFQTEVNHFACLFKIQKSVWMEYSFINVRGNHILLE